VVPREVQPRSVSLLLQRVQTGFRAGVPLTSSYGRQQGPPPRPGFYANMLKPYSLFQRSNLRSTQASCVICHLRAFAAAMMNAPPCGPKKILIEIEIKAATEKG